MEMSAAEKLELVRSLRKLHGDTGMSPLGFVNILAATVKSIPELERSCPKCGSTLTPMEVLRVALFGQPCPACAYSTRARRPTHARRAWARAHKFGVLNDPRERR